MPIPDRSAPNPPPAPGPARVPATVPLTRAAFTALVARERPLLDRQMRRQFRRHTDDVEDAIQTACARLWARAGVDAVTDDRPPSDDPSWPAIDDPGRWLYRVTHRLLTDEARARQRRREEALDPGLGAVLVADASPVEGPVEEGAGGRERRQGGPAVTAGPLAWSGDVPDTRAGDDEIAERRRALAYALAQLSPAKRELIVDFHVRGLSYRQIAARDGERARAEGRSPLSAGSLGTSLLRARVRLRQALDEFAARTRSTPSHPSEGR